MADTTIKCWEVLVKFADEFSHYGYYETKAAAVGATKKYEKQNNYYPDWRVEERLIVIEQGS